MKRGICLFLLACSASFCAMPSEAVTVREAVVDAVKGQGFDLPLGDRGMLTVSFMGKFARLTVDASDNARFIESADIEINGAENFARATVYFMQPLTMLNNCIGIRIWYDRSKSGLPFVFELLYDYE